MKIYLNLFINNLSQGLLLFLCRCQTINMNGKWYPTFILYNIRDSILCVVCYMTVSTLVHIRYYNVHSSSISCREMPGAYNLSLTGELSQYLLTSVHKTYENSLLNSITNFLNEKYFTSLMAESVHCTMHAAVVRFLQYGTWDENPSKTRCTLKCRHVPFCWTTKDL
jgi:hypothetical protein